MQSTKGDRFVTFALWVYYRKKKNIYSFYKTVWGVAPTTLSAGKGQFSTFCLTFFSLYKYITVGGKVLSYFFLPNITKHNVTLVPCLGRLSKPSEKKFGDDIFNTGSS